MCKRASLYAAIEGLGRLAEVLERRRRQLAGQVGLSPLQWRVLEEVAREAFAIATEPDGVVSIGIPSALIRAWAR